MSLFRRLLPLLVLALLISGLPLDAQANSNLKRPDAPLSNDQYRPRFVTQTDEPVWDDCAWASATMLFDKWTNRRVNREAFRRSQSNRVGGSNMKDLRRGFANYLGVDARWSPSGGDPLTLDDLLSRLERGGGAVVFGYYSDMPEPFVRWSRSFATKPRRETGHAVYVQDYNRAKNRVWMMDPLGRGYNGEWTPVAALRKFMWIRSDGLVTAMATPEPQPLLAHFEGIEWGQPIVGSERRAGRETTIELPITSWPEEGHMPEINLSFEWKLTDDSALGEVSEAARLALESDMATIEAGASEVGHNSTAVSERLASNSPDPLTAPLDWERLQPANNLTSVSTRLSADRNGLDAILHLPVRPGNYQLQINMLTISEQRIDSEHLNPVQPINVRVETPFNASYDVAGELIVGAGHELELPVRLANSGLLSWSGASIETPTRLAASWLDGEVASSALLAGQLTLPELSAGASIDTTIAVLAPSVPGNYLLQIDVVDDDYGSLSSQGVAPGLVRVKVIGFDSSAVSASAPLGQLSSQSAVQGQP